MRLSRIRRELGICCVRQPLRQARVMSLTSLTLVFGFIGAIATGCSSPTPSVGTDAYQPKAVADGYASSGCFYSNDFAAERTIAGGVLHWCGPEPRAGK